MGSGKSTGWFRYLPISEEARSWGLYVLDAGFTLIPPGSAYPPHQHPDDHHFTWEDGRTLPSFTLVYITRGSGLIETAASGQTKIEAGDVFIVFPGDWHRYRPDSETGWDEYWVEFDGDHAQRIMDHRLFSREKPVIHVGPNDTLLKLFLELSDLIRTSPLGYEHTVAAQTMLIIARVLASARRTRGEDGTEDEFIRQACFRIQQQSAEEIDFAEMAQDLGLSYTGFRKKFRRVAGMPPAQYQQQVRLNRAKHWLSQSDRPITEIAQALGYESIFYFSRLFKRKAGMPPTEYRKRNRARRKPEA